MAEWIYTRNGKQYGPVSQTEIEEYIRTKSIPTDKFKRTDMSEWVFGSEVAEVISDAWKEKNQGHSNVPDPPFFSTVLFVLAGLSILGGIILALVFWPRNEGYMVSGLSWSIAWFVTGVVEAVLFASAGCALMYLQQIVRNTSQKSG